MKKLITFDCYGTLIDTAPYLQEIAKIGEEHQIDGQKLRDIYELNEARLMYAEPYLSLDELMREALERCDVMMGTSFMKDEYDRMLRVQMSLKAFPEVVSTLKELAQRGYERVIMSNSCRAIMEQNLKALDHQIDDLVLAEDVHAYKPQLTFFQQAEDILSTRERTHCHVAQGYFEDIIPGKRLGWNCVWVNRDAEKGQDKWMPKRTVTSLDQILSIFK